MRNIDDSKGKIFRHFKGDLYLLEGFVINSETREKMVLYRALYGECGLFVRPYNMFIEEVLDNKLNPTGQKYRFEEFEVKSENNHSINSKSMI
ncbi:MAG: DUF1653 domain-containing protein [Clostridium sp.]|uniref:DUF1653 domain-containing protein n=1 Tax=Clostridium sp. TaxID=1506 RepID=UPI002FC919B7